jgi:serine/threonine protein kinase
MEERTDKIITGQLPSTEEVSTSASAAVPRMAHMQTAQARPEAGATKQGIKTVGPYVLINQIGRGAFGVVWLAEKRGAIATTQVALKLLNSEDLDLKAISNEAAIWVRASGHPNILPIIEADIYDGQVVIASEYAPDGTLGAWMKRHSGLAPSIPSAVQMLVGILSGLEHLHTRRIIHRDLKPDNILLRPCWPPT